MRRPIVLDTNCLLQIIPLRSKYHFVWEAFLEGRYTLCVTDEILHEYEEVLGQKGKRGIADLIMTLITHSDDTELYKPYYKWHLIETDPDDNKFVDCAIVADALYIVSDDHHFDVLRTIPFPPVNVITLDDFGRMVREEAK